MYSLRCDRPMDENNIAAEIAKQQSNSARYFGDRWTFVAFLAIFRAHARKQQHCFLSESLVVTIVLRNVEFL